MKWIPLILAATVSCMASDPAAADPLVVDGALTTSGKVEIAYQAVHVADWLQTLQIARNPDRWSETNPILGEHPSVSDVNQYFLATAVGHALISHYIPSAKMTRVWQGTTIAIQLGYVIHNHSLGISIKFGD